MERAYLSVIIPAYNEQSNLTTGVLQQVDDYLARRSYPFQVIIVDDGSKDNTVELIQNFIKNKPNYQLIQNQHGGKAIAVMTGMLLSTGQIVLFTDMDQATPISEIEKLLPKFKQGYDVVIGSRSGRQGAPAIRKLMAWGFALIRTLILGLPFKDTQCGFKAFSRPSVTKIFQPLMELWKSHNASGAAVNAGFDVETLFIAKKLNLKVAEVGVEWHYVGTERVQAISDSLDAVADMFRIKSNDWGGKYPTQGQDV